MKRSGWIGGLLLVGLLGLHLRGDSAPDQTPQPGPEAGRFELFSFRLANKITTTPPFDALFDNSTGRLWNLLPAADAKTPRFQWVLAADAPDVATPTFRAGRFTLSSMAYPIGPEAKARVSFIGMFDNDTGQLWVLEETNAEKGPPKQWVLAADVPR